VTDDATLLAALEVIRARGAIGERSLPAAIAHADRFVDLIPAEASSLVDLGSGGGLPALVIAARRPDLAVTMVERRATRADLLRRAITSLGIEHHCYVLATDVDVVAQDRPRSFDVVTARSFADLPTTARAIDALLAPGGVALVSEPPEDRSGSWAAALENYELLDDGVHQGVRRFVRGS
jgi:16S rRNA G527 N7-methylase RsmG